MKLYKKDIKFIDKFCGIPKNQLNSITPAVGKRLIDLTLAVWSADGKVPPVKSKTKKQAQKK